MKYQKNEDKYQPTPMEKLLYRISYLTLFSAGLLVLYFGYTILFPTQVFKLNKPLHVKEQQVKSGQNITLEIDYCKTKDSPSLTYFSLIDNAVLPTLSTVTDFPVGCHKINYMLNIVASTPTDTYKVALVKSYPLYVFQGVRYTFFSNTFHVTNSL